MFTAKDNGQQEKSKRIDFQFPLLILKTEALKNLYNRLGSWAVSHSLSWAFLAGFPIVTTLGIYIFFNSLYTLLTVPEVREIGRELGPQAIILLPGINPYLPILYGWIGLIIALAVHEGAHGIIARTVGLSVKSSVLLFLIVIPIGAGVDIDEKQMKEAKIRDSTRVLAAGVGGNMIIALVCLIGILIISSGLSPVVDGLYIIEVFEGMPAEEAGLLEEDVIVMIDEQQVISFEDLDTAFKDYSPGESIDVTVVRGVKWSDKLSFSVKLVEDENRTIMGVKLAEMLLEQRLSIYQKTPLIHFQVPTLGFSQSYIPFSDALHAFYNHPLGENWYILANILFWIWFINVNIAIFNALPIYPLDGGRAFENLLKSALGRRVEQATISRLTMTVTFSFVILIVFSFALPFIF